MAGIPDSGTGHAIGYANEAGIPYGRPFVKYTPTWPRSFMPQDQRVRDLVARMKLIPIRELIRGKRLLFCEDSIVRGTQLKDTDPAALRLRRAARSTCGRPARRWSTAASSSTSRARGPSWTWPAAGAIKELEGDDDSDLDEYADPTPPRHAAMVERIRQRLGLTSLKYQRLDDLVAAIGLPKDKLCTYCWDGAE